MAFKVNIGTKQGKTFKLETESEELLGKEIGSKVSGKEVSPNLEGYEFEITGASDIAGLPSMSNVDGISLKHVLLTYGKGLHKKPRGLKKKNKKPKGMRMRKTLRGKVISPAIIQLNLKLIKQGHKSLEEIFPEQNKPKEKAEEAKKE